MRFPRQCDFHFAADCRRIEAVPHPGLDAETLEHLLVDQVLPRALSRRGRLAVHASSIEIGDSLALFVGDSGRGKSTLAALLARRGFRLHSDDCVLIRQSGDHVSAISTYPSLRLFDDSTSGVFEGAAPERSAGHAGKSRLALAESAVRIDEGRVAAIFLLDERGAAGSAIGMVAAPPAQACIELITNSFQLDLLDPAQASEQLRLAARVATRAPVWRLTYPHDFSRSSELVDALLECLSSSHRVADTCPC